MFLVDSALAAQEWQGILDEVQRILVRAGAEVISLKKWDERHLCYDIQRKSRGTYLLAYFNCDTDKVNGIERDVQLSERIMRALVLRTDGMTQQDIEKPTPAETQPPQDTSNTDDAAGIPPMEAANSDIVDEIPDTTETV
jgi:small subunit ribosomal protein S6